jgi:DNA modification methylase
VDSGTLQDDVAVLALRVDSGDAVSCYVGDVRDGLRGFIADGVRAQTCVTSPPYWGLRDYGTAQWDGGDADCKHGPRVMGNANKGAVREVLDGDRTRCHGCGATRVDRQLGLEPTPAEYVANMVEVFRLVRDVLADDGTLWLNIGDSYASDVKGSGGAGRSTLGPNGDLQNIGFQKMEPRRFAHGMKPKDLVGIPWRLAFALQADGWYLRSDIIWHKPNPMPESVTDRPTKAHEYLFLLAKNERYFYDAAAIAEAANSADRPQPSPADKTISPNATPWLDNRYAPGASGYGVGADGKRNRRTVWTVATQPYSEAHFATFPTALVEPCILAGTSARGHCPACGSGWERVVERTAMVVDRSERTHELGRTRSSGTMLEPPTTKTLGWQPTCECGGDPVPGVVLDPFMGSGTVAQVAQDLGRRWIGCELNPEYVALQSKRAAQLGMELA